MGDDQGNGGGDLEVQVGGEEALPSTPPTEKRAPRVPRRGRIPGVKAKVIAEGEQAERLIRGETLMGVREEEDVEDNEEAIPAAFRVGRGTKYAYVKVYKATEGTHLADYPPGAVPLGRIEEFLKQRHGKDGIEFRVDLVDAHGDVLGSHTYKVADSPLLSEDDEEPYRPFTPPTPPPYAYPPTSVFGPFGRGSYRRDDEDLDTLKKQIEELKVGSATQAQIELKRMELDRTERREAREAEATRRCEERDARIVAEREARQQRLDAEREMLRMKQEADAKRMEEERKTRDAEERSRREQMERELKDSRERFERELSIKTDSQKGVLETIMGIGTALAGALQPIVAAKMSATGEVEKARLAEERAREDRRLAEERARSEAEQRRREEWFKLLPIGVELVKEMLHKDDPTEHAARLLELVNSLQKPPSMVDRLMELAETVVPSLPGLVSAAKTPYALPTGTRLPVRVEQPQQKQAAGGKSGELGRLVKVGEPEHDYISEKFTIALQRAAGRVPAEMFAKQEVEANHVSYEALAEIYNAMHSGPEAQARILAVVWKIPGLRVEGFIQRLEGNPNLKQWFSTLIGSLSEIYEAVTRRAQQGPQEAPEAKSEEGEEEGESDGE